MKKTGRYPEWRGKGCRGARGGAEDDDEATEMAREHVDHVGVVVVEEERDGGLRGFTGHVMHCVFFHGPVAVDDDDEHATAMSLDVGLSDAER